MSVHIVVTAVFCVGAVVASNPNSCNDLQTFSDVRIPVAQRLTQNEFDKFVVDADLKESYVLLPNPSPITVFTNYNCRITKTGVNYQRVCKGFHPTCKTCVDYSFPITLKSDGHRISFSYTDPNGQTVDDCYWSPCPSEYILRIQCPSNSLQQNNKCARTGTRISMTFKRFKEHSEFMFKGPLSSKTEEIQCNYLMLWVGEKGRQIYSTWDLSNDQRKKLKSYYDKFEEYCKLKSNIIYNTYLFKSRAQQENEPFEQFVTELKTLIKDCDYPVGMQQDLIRDHIVFGVRSSKVREKLIVEGSDLTLEKCVDVAHTYELSQSQAQAIPSGSTTSQHSVDAINRQWRRGNGRDAHQRDRKMPPHQQQQPRRQQRFGLNIFI